MTRWGVFGGLVMSVGLATAGRGAEIDLKSYLEQGQLEEAASVLAARLKDAPGDQRSRFGLGVVRVLRGIERFNQSLQPHVGGGRLLFIAGDLGLRPSDRVPDKPLTYAALRDMLLEFARSLEQAEQTLSQVQGADVKLRLDVSQIRLDLDADGKAGDGETLARFWSGAGSVPGGPAGGFRGILALDAADAVWLRGYCHVALAQLEFVLALDFHDWFERAGQLAFKRTATPYEFLRSEPGRGGWDSEFIADVIAFIHTLNFEIAEPERMRKSLAHLEQVIACSRASWKLILAETDDDAEWIPSPRQKSASALPPVTDEMVAAWGQLLDETEQVLQGKRLLPFWRSGVTKGVNLRRAFLESNRFDPVLWFQGTAAAPFLEEGEITDREVWGRITNVYGRNWPLFLFWFN